MVKEGLGGVWREVKEGIIESEDGVINGTGMRRRSRRVQFQMRGKRRECKQVIRGGTGNRSYEG